MYVYTEGDNRLFAAQMATKEHYGKGFIAGVQAYEKRLLEKMFPYDGVDKNRYSINAQAVYTAIVDVLNEVVSEVK